MKTTRLIAVLVGLIVFAAFTAPASAMYQPTLGRWLQRDPAAYSDGHNTLAYLHSSPSSGVDPSGLKRQVFVFEGVGGSGRNLGSGGEDEPFVKDVHNQEAAIRADPIALSVRKVVNGRGGVSDPFALIDLVGDLLESRDLVNGKYVSRIDDMEWDLSSYNVKFPDAAAKRIKSIATLDRAAGAATRPTTATGPACKYDTIILVSFSAGGRALLDVALELEKLNIKVDLAFTVDPVQRPGSGEDVFKKPSNVTRFVNYFEQTDESPLLNAFQGRSIKNADIDMNVERDMRDWFVHKTPSFTNGRVNKEMGNAHEWITQYVKDMEYLSREVKDIPVTRPSYKAKN